MHRGQSDPFIGAGIGLSVLLFVWYVYPGFWSPVTPHFDGACRAIPLTASAEDLALDPSNGLLYFTSYDRVPRQAGQSRASQGSVMVLDLNAAEPVVRAALAAEVPGMAPSGVSLYTPSAGPRRMFVASLTNPNRHSVEVFEESASGNFVHVETIRDPMIWSPVAIVAVGPRQFYVANDAWRRPNSDDNQSREERRNERRARATRTGVIYFDGERTKQAAPRVNEALGLGVSHDGRTLYVAEAGMTERLLVYDRDPASGELKLRDRVPLLGAPHNITVDSGDNVWITAHPKWIAYTRALGDPTVRSPTQVLKFSPYAETQKRVTEVYMNRGEEISTGTVAAVYKDQLVIGSISDRKLLVCSQPGLSPPVFSGPEKDT